jgi:NTP pyrophosphatase (non-canonical NTP hydrolase)
MRSEAEIRADLEHPHTAALTALHSTTVGDGPIGRLLRDVEPLLDRCTFAEQFADETGQDSADLWDAVDKARAVCDDALANIRRRGQAKAWAQAEAAVVIATSARSCDDCKGRPNIWCSWCTQPPPGFAFGHVLPGPGPAQAGHVTLAEMQANYLEVRQHTLSTAGLPHPEKIYDQVEYVIDEARELKSAIEDLTSKWGVEDETGRKLTLRELLTAVRHEIADVVLATVTLASYFGLAVEDCIAEKTEADRGRG